ncbi:MAG: tetratricopeptide repeat protein [Cyanobacteria bacterium REEB67]|nr:tetratricopeptide repeat protein [Cyanobacteria bacterium REEB67]
MQIWQKQILDNYFQVADSAFRAGYDAVAEQMYAAVLAEPACDKGGMVAALYGLAALLMRNGRRAQAGKNLRRALKLILESGDSDGDNLEGLIPVACLLADNYLSLGQSGRALPLLKMALARVRSSGICGGKGAAHLPLLRRIALIYNSSNSPRRSRFVNDCLAALAVANHGPEVLTKAPVTITSFSL